MQLDLTHLPLSLSLSFRAPLSTHPFAESRRSTKRQDGIRMVALIRILYMLQLGRNGRSYVQQRQMKPLANKQRASGCVPKRIIVWRIINAEGLALK
jgi:hypothetical protein